MIKKARSYLEKIDLKRMNLERVYDIWSSFRHLLFTIWVLIIDLIYRILYFTKPRVFISTAPKSNVLTQSATQTHRDIIEGHLTCLEVVNAFIERLEEVNQLVNGICYRNYESARVKAQQMDEMLSNLSIEKRNELSIHRPFFGVPITVKNNMNVKGFMTTCGWMKLKDNVAQEDAPAVHRMREAGAIIIALTNVPEFCLWIETSNSMFGQTNNPYDTRRTSGGSSGGEGALLGAGASVIGLGTDIAGSIRVPCMFNGLFGLKPSTGISPIDGLYPIDKSSRAYLQTVGPMCRYAEDLLPMFKSLCLPSRFNQLESAKDLKEIKFFAFPGFKGWCTEKIGNEQRDVFEKTVNFFEEYQDRSIPFIDIPYQEEMYSIVAISVQDGLEKPYCDLLEGTRTLSELFFDGMKTILGSKTTKNAQLSLQVNVNSILMHGNTKESVEKAISVRDRVREKMCSLLGDDGVLIVPGWPIPPPFHNQTVWKHSGITQTAIWNVLGLPVITIPCGLNKDRLPLSIQLVAGRNHDLSLLRLGEVMDGHSNHCINPDLFTGYIGPWTLNEKL